MVLRRKLMYFNLSYIILISKLLKHLSRAKIRAPACSRGFRRIREVV